MTSVRISDQMLNLASLNLGLREALKAFLSQNASCYHFLFSFSFSGGGELSTEVEFVRLQAKD